MSALARSPPSPQGFNCSWLWHATSPLATEAKKSLKVKKVPKRANNCVRMQKKCYNLHTSRELVYPVCLSPSCLQANWCLQGTPSNSDEHSSCRQLQINSRAIFSGRISWNLLWPPRIMIYFIRATFPKFLDGRSGLFHHHELSNCRQWSRRSSNL